MKYEHHYPEAIEDLEKILKNLKTNSSVELEKTSLIKVLRHCDHTKVKHITGTYVFEEIKEIFVKKKAWSKELKELEERLTDTY